MESVRAGSWSPLRGNCKTEPETAAVLWEWLNKMTIPLQTKTVLESATLSKAAPWHRQWSL
jgi:hypothetical protein